MPYYTAFDALLLIVALLVLPGLDLVGNPFRLRKSSRTSLYWRTTLRNIVFTAALLFAWYWEDRPLAALGLGWPVPFWGWIGFGVTALLCVYYAMALRTMPIGEDLEAERRYLEKNPLVPRSATEFRVFQFVVISGAIAEELLFRGFLFWALQSVFGIWVTAIVSALAFAVGHLYQGADRLLWFLFTGFIAGVAYAFTESLWWLILAHVVVNVSSGLRAWRLSHARGSVAAAASEEGS